MPGASASTRCAAARLLPRWAWRAGQGRALGLASSSLRPGPAHRKNVVYGIDIKRVMRTKLVLGIADGWLAADGSIIYRAMDLKVGLFRDERRCSQMAADVRARRGSRY